MNKYFLWLDRFFFLVVLLDFIYHIQIHSINGFHIGWLVVATLLVVGSEYYTNGPGKKRFE